MTYGKHIPFLGRLELGQLSHCIRMTIIWDMLLVTLSCPLTSTRPESIQFVIQAEWKSQRNSDQLSLYKKWTNKIIFSPFPSPVTCPMNEVLTASTGVIMSQSPGNGFPHFESCSWVVKVEPGFNITFTIEHFQTSRQFDELEIFDGESECVYIVHLFVLLTRRQHDLDCRMIYIHTHTSKFSVQQPAAFSQMLHNY